MNEVKDNDALFKDKYTRTNVILYSSPYGTVRVYTVSAVNEK